MTNEKRITSHTSWPGTAVAMRSYVMAGLVPAIPIQGARLCAPERDHRDKPGDDGLPWRVSGLGVFGPR